MFCLLSAAAAIAIAVVAVFLVAVRILMNLAGILANTGRAL